MMQSQRPLFHRAPRRLKAYQFIKAELAAGRPFPSMRAIADHMGWINESGARDACLTMCGFDRVLRRTAVKDVFDLVDRPPVNAERASWPAGHTVRMSTEGNFSVSECECGWRLRSKKLDRENWSIERHWRWVEKKWPNIAQVNYRGDPL
jgi:hypothetical protein